MAAWPQAAHLHARPAGGGDRGPEDVDHYAAEREACDRREKEIRELEANLKNTDPEKEGKREFMEYLLRELKAER